MIASRSRWPIFRHSASVSFRLPFFSYRVQKSSNEGQRMASCTWSFPLDPLPEFPSPIPTPLPTPTPIRGLSFGFDSVKLRLRLGFSALVDVGSEDLGRPPFLPFSACKRLKVACFSRCSSIHSRQIVPSDSMNLRRRINPQESHGFPISASASSMGMGPEDQRYRIRVRYTPRSSMLRGSTCGARSVG